MNDPLMEFWKISGGARNENVKAYEEDIVVIYLRKIKMSYLILDYAEYHKKHKWKKDWKLRKLSMI